MYKTPIDLLYALKKAVEEDTGGLLLPTAPTQNKPSVNKPPDVYLMHLPDGSQAKSKAPYIILQVVTGEDRQAAGNRGEAYVTVRAICSIYSPDGDDEGGIRLLELIERIRQGFIRRIFVENSFVLDRDTGVEFVIYPENLDKYHVGEIHSRWQVPSFKQEVSF